MPRQPRRQQAKPGFRESEIRDRCSSHSIVPGLRFAQSGLHLLGNLHVNHQCLDLTSGIRFAHSVELAWA